MIDLHSDHHNYVYFHDVLFKLIRHEIGRDIENRSKLMIIRKEEERLNKLIQFRIKKHIQETQMVKIKLTGNQLNKFNPLTSHLYYKISYHYMMYFLSNYDNLSQRLYHQENFETLEAPGTHESVKVDPCDKVSNIENDSYNKIQEENKEDEVCFETENKLIVRNINDNKKEVDYKNHNYNDSNSNKYFENYDIFNMNNERKIQTSDKILKLDSYHKQDNLSESLLRRGSSIKTEDDAMLSDRQKFCDVEGQPIFTDVIKHKNSDVLKFNSSPSGNSKHQNTDRECENFNLSSSEKNFDENNLEQKLIIKQRK